MFALQLEAIGFMPFLPLRFSFLSRVDWSSKLTFLALHALENGLA